MMNNFVIGFLWVYNTSSSEEYVDAFIDTKFEPSEMLINDRF